MKLEEAIQRLDKSAGKPSTTGSVRIKQKFSNILQEVKYKNLTSDQLQIIEEELDNIFKDLDLEAENVEKELKYRLKILLNYLRLKFSLVPEGYCTSFGLKTGLMAGLLIMLVLQVYLESSLKFYTPLGGLIIGFTLGSFCDRRQKRRGKSLLTRMV